MAYSAPDFSDDVINLCVELELIPTPKPWEPPGCGLVNDDASENDSEALVLVAIRRLHNEVKRLRAAAMPKPIDTTGAVAAAAFAELHS